MAKSQELNQVLKKQLSDRVKAFLFSLQGRISCLTLGSVIFISVVITVLYVGITYYVLKSEINRQTQLSLSKLERIMSVPLMKKDFVMLVDIIDEEVKSNNFSYIWVTDDQGYVIACNDENQIMKPIDKSMFGKDSFKTLSMKDNGSISILANYDIIYDISKKAFWSATVLMITILIVLIYWTNRFARHLSEPVKRAVEAYGQMASGNFDVSLPRSPIPEIDNLTLSLVDTSAKLKFLTKKLHEEKTLAENAENKYRSIFENAVEGIFQAGPQGGYLSANPALAQIYGYDSPADLLMNISDISKQLYVDPGRRDELIELLAKQDVIKDFEAEIYRKDGSTGRITLNARAVRDDHGRLLFMEGFVEDITERHRVLAEQERMQAELRHAQKMEALGTLAGGIAHDLNNVLQVISGYLDLITIESRKCQVVVPHLREIEEAVGKASILIRQVLTFSRKVKPELQKVDLNKEVISAIKMLERTIPKMISLETNLAENLWIIDGDPNQLGQVLMNLGSNARDAMPDGGQIVFTTGNVALSKHYTNTHPELQPGPCVLLQVADTGHGMDEETKLHIFEPFFTTKDIGQGTGLGMSTVHGIVKAHNGSITCVSQLGHGTTFEIYFPAQPAQAMEEKQAKPQELGLEGAESVLVVDDEAAIREAASEILEQYGYRPLRAASGEEALEIYADLGPKIDLVLLDLGMPGMGGRKCLQELMRINPEVKIVIASGYSHSDQAMDCFHLGAKGFVGKPYRLTDLLTRVREVLNSNGSESRNSQTMPPV